MYCALCRRPVEARRQIGLGTVVLAVISAGISLLAVPFYSKRCSICKSAAVSLRAPDGGELASGAAPLAQLTDLKHRLTRMEAELEESGVELERVRTERDFYRQLLGEPPAEPRDGTRE
jgi:hypothetical protein